MEFSLHIVICGKSLLLTTLANSLRGHRDIAVTQVGDQHPDFSARVAALGPDVLLVKRNGERLRLPGARTIEVDMDHSVLTVDDEPPIPAAGVHDVLDIIWQTVGEEKRINVTRWVVGH